MGCVVIEHFPENEFTDDQFGQNRDAWVDAARAKPSKLILNTHAVLAFEDITIRTSRPRHPLDNKEDHIEGVRIKTSWGQHLIVFNDLPMDFATAMDAACRHQKPNEITTRYSDYWRKFFYKN